MTTTRDPETPAEWHAAVDAAEAYLMLESARLYGLVTGGPEVNVPRCEQILARGRRQGIVPNQTGVDAYIAAIARDGTPTP